MNQTIHSEWQYCNHWGSGLRRKTHEVMIGGCPLGGEHPVRVQSMTTTDTMDTEATVAQSRLLFDAGCDYVRITAPNIRAAENLKEIRQRLHHKGYTGPLIADIHFTPNAAEAAARLVEKIRINPGNYADRKQFQKMEYSDAEYDGELNRIYERFAPLVKVCREYGTAMRIGTNHGSLSDRIMSRYGDSPLGMVESALEFIRICVDLNYHQLVLSMKASNPLVMVYAYRLLVLRMDASGLYYPLHLGVTEAGAGLEGRIKSAAGIGALMADGLGDTIRVSLTEDPEHEVPVAKQLVDRFAGLTGKMEKGSRVPKQPLRDPYQYRRQRSEHVENIGGSYPPVVIADLSQLKDVSGHPENAGYRLEKEGVWIPTDQAADYVYTGSRPLSKAVMESVTNIRDYQNDNKSLTEKPVQKFIQIQSDLPTQDSDEPVFLGISPDKFPEWLDTLSGNQVLVVDFGENPGLLPMRNGLIALREKGWTGPVIIRADYGSLAEEEQVLAAAADCGGLLIDGFADGFQLTPGSELINRVVFGFLQATRTRISQTEYISCPSCGRTRFDLQETSARIRERTNHLKGLKIGIMGCVVNGPGEMADADYGYVGTGIDKVSLYRGHDVVVPNIPADGAVEALINLIKSDGRWIEPPES